MDQNPVYDFSEAVIKYGVVKACGAIPIIGNIAADIAQDIINIAERARHNKTVCKYISDRVQESLNTITKFPPHGDIGKSRKVYEDTLNEIREYVTEIEKPGKFSDKAKKRLMEIVNANHAVAVKKNSGINLKTELESIKKQAKIISLLSNCGEIEKLFGIYIKNEKDLYIVTKWMQNGNLQEYLDKNESIPWMTKFKIAEQIAKGLTFCINANVYHRDVRSKNVLLDENLDAKLTNFEMSRRISDKSKEMQIESIRWTAPEKLEYPKQPYTDKCEVYSFAILLWEISTHKLPFNDIKSPSAVSEKVRKGERPNPFSDDTPDQYEGIVKRAWHQNHKKRPSIDNLRKQLCRLKIKVPDINQAISLHEEKRYEEAFYQFQKLAQEDNPLALYYTGLYLYKGTY
ncbi:1583_t:CDS:2, partial [Dentiscutata heterogama]